MHGDSGYSLYSVVRAVSYFGSVLFMNAAGCRVDLSHLQMTIFGGCPHADTVSWLLILLASYSFLYYSALKECLVGVLFCFVLFLVLLLYKVVSGKEFCTSTAVPGCSLCVSYSHLALTTK